MNTSRYRRNIKLDYYTIFFRNFNLTHGIWVFFLGTVKGFSLFEIGLFEGLFHFSSIIMEVPTGIYADVFGRRNSRIISIIVYILYVVIILTSNNFYLIGFGFFLCGLSYTFESGSGEALIFDSLKEIGEERNYKKIAGNKEIIYQLSSSVALLIGGYLALRSFNITFIITIIALTMGFIPLIMMRETPRDLGVESFKLSSKMYDHFVYSTKVAFSNKKLLFLIFLGALLAAPVTSIFFYFQTYLNELKYTTFGIGLLLAFHSLFGALGGFLADFLERVFKEKLVLYIVPLFIVIMFWLIQVDEIIFIPFVLLGFTDSVFYVVLSDYINQIIPSEQRATILSFNNLAFSVVMIIIFPLLGFMGDMIGLKISLLFLAILVSLIYIMLLIVLSKNSKVKIY